MRALIVAGEGRTIGELGAQLVAEGYELSFVAAEANDLVTAASGASLIFIDMQEGLEKAELACARLQVVGDNAQFRLLHGDPSELQAAAHLLDGRAVAFFVRDAPMNDLRLRAIAGSVRTRRHASDALHDLEHSHAEITSMVDSLREGILVQTRTGEVLRTNAAARRMLGLSQDDMVSRRWRAPDWVLTHMDGTVLDKNLVPSLLCLRTGHPVRDFQMRMVRPDGGAVALSVNVEPIFAGESGLPTTVVSSVTDITNQWAHEDALRKLLERVNDGVLIHREGTILFMNARWATLVGAADRLEEADKGSPGPARELRFPRPDGSVVTALVHTFPTIFQGKPALLTYARDVSEQRSLEAKLIASNRMAALGRLAANVGHEVNNPLAFLVGSAERALSQVTNGEDASNVVASIRNVLDGAARVQNIVADLKVLSRPGSGESGATEVATVLESCVRIAESSIASRARVKMDLLSRSRAKCNEARIGQVFLNLLMNAAEAIPPGDPEHNTITVTTEDRPPDVVVTIADTGAGIPPEHIGSIFEPFFTTKADGRGTGLGLSISHALITEQGGRIAAESAVGKGTRMVVHLPMAASAPPKEGAAPLRTPASADGGGGRAEKGGSGPARRYRVLVVDDEVQLGRLIQSFLADYDVTVASSGAEGRIKLDATPPFDLVLCDLMMPDVTGMDLYQHVERTRPELCPRFVFMTGGAFTSPAVAFLDAMTANGNACVEKPFRIDGLVASIAAKLAQLEAVKTTGAATGKTG